MMCSKDSVGQFKADEGGDCNAGASYTGKEGCRIIGLAPAINLVKPFVGAILIVLGLLMTFAGTKFLFYVFAGLVFTAITAISFMICYSVLPASSVTPVALGGCLVVSMIAGGGVAFITYRFAKEWAVALLAAWGGLVLGLIAAEVAGVTGGTAPLLMGVAGAVICGYLGRNMKRMVQAIGTAFVGSFFIARGVACYAGGYPSEMALPEAGSAIDIKKNMGMWMYLGGVVVGTIVGTLVQLYVFRDLEKDDDDYMNDDEGRVCGCF